MANRYKHIFFDLDHTLWDFEKNSKETLLELYTEHLLNTQPDIFSFDEFYNTYYEINYEYWEQYRMGLISRDNLRTERFKVSFEKLGTYNNDLVDLFADQYISLGPKKKALIPYAKEVLDYLHSNYKLHIITNGFEEVQYKKMESSGIIEYFDEIITSESINVKKPDPRIYHHSLQQINASANDCLMVGDELHVDILGAKSAGIDQVFFNPEAVSHQEKVTFEIRCLSEMKTFL